MLTVKQFADIFNVTVRSVHNWIGVGIVRPGEVVRRLCNGMSVPIQKAYNDKLNATLRERLNIKPNHNH